VVLVGLQSVCVSYRTGGSGKKAGNRVESKPLGILRIAFFVFWERTYAIGFEGNETFWKAGSGIYKVLKTRQL
jgi:hypothetical protein